MNSEKINFFVNLYKNEQTFLPLYGVRTNINDLTDECKYFILNSVIVDRIILNTITPIEEPINISLQVGTCTNNDEIEILGDFSATIFTNVIDFSLQVYIEQYKSLIIKVINNGNKNLKLNGSLILVY
jgi:hypothetical protein